MKRHLGLLGIVLALAALIALTAGMTVGAQTATQTPQVESDPQGPPPDGAGPRGGPQHGRLSSEELEAVAQLLGTTADDLSAQIKEGETLADLADAAGVDLQALYDAAEAARETARETAKAARLEAQKESIAAAVEDGSMTQAQADWMLEGLDNGYGMGFGPGMFGLGHKRGGDNEREAVAAVLNMTTDQLELQLWGGRTYADLAAAAGVDVEDVESAATEARREALSEQIAQAVEDGSITQEHADWLLEGLKNGYLDKASNGLQGGAPDGKLGGHRPGRPSDAPNRGAPPSADDQA